MGEQTNRDQRLKPLLCGRVAEYTVIKIAQNGKPSGQHVRMAMFANCLIFEYSAVFDKILLVWFLGGKTFKE